MPFDREVRHQGIAATELSSLYDENPDLPQADLQRIKLSEPGALEGPVSASRQRQRDMGDIFEPAILKMAARDHQLKLIVPEPRTLRYQDTVLVGSPDALTEDGGGVESKFVSEFSPIKLVDDDELLLPRQWIIQVQAYLGITGRAYWLLAVFYRGTMHYFWFKPDQELFARFLADGQYWWRQHIIERVPVPVERPTDITRRWLNLEYPYHKKPDIRPAEESELEMLTEYLWLRVNQEEMEQRRDKLEYDIQSAIQNREGIEWADGKVTWRSTKGRKITDWKSMAIGLRQQFLEPAKHAELEEFYTRQGKDYRKFMLTAPALKEARAAAKKEEEDAA